MSMFSKKTAANGTTEPPPVPQHPILKLLKSFGVDPAELLTHVQSARDMAQQTYEYFQNRLTMIENRQKAEEFAAGERFATLLQRDEECLVLLREIVTLLKNQTQLNITSHAELDRSNCQYEDGQKCECGCVVRILEGPPAVEYIGTVFKGE